MSSVPFGPGTGNVRRNVAQPNQSSRAVDVDARMGDTFPHRTEAAGSVRAVTNRVVAPPAIAPPAARYAHAVVSESPGRMLHTSGVVPTAPDGTVPDGVAAPGWYRPTDRGLEARLGEKMAWLRSLEDSVGGGD